LGVEVRNPRFEIVSDSFSKGTTNAATVVNNKKIRIGAMYIRHWYNTRMFVVWDCEGLCSKS
jgi:hypothetical protein